MHFSSPTHDVQNEDESGLQDHDDLHILDLSEYRDI